MSTLLWYQHDSLFGSNVWKIKSKVYRNKGGRQSDTGQTNKLPTTICNVLNNFG